LFESLNLCLLHNTIASGVHTSWWCLPYAYVFLIPATQSYKPEARFSVAEFVVGSVAIVCYRRHLDSCTAKQPASRESCIILHCTVLRLLLACQPMNLAWRQHINMRPSWCLYDNTTVCNLHVGSTASLVTRCCKVPQWQAKTHLIGQVLAICILQHSYQVKGLLLFDYRRPALAWYLHPRLNILWLWHGLQMVSNAHSRCSVGACTVLVSGQHTDKYSLIVARGKNTQLSLPNNVWQPLLIIATNNTYATMALGQCLACMFAGRPDPCAE
jgi:hypothetical protein